MNRRPNDPQLWTAWAARQENSIAATLIMESHGLAPAVRSQSFSSMSVWSKLYQAGQYYLDMALGPADRSLSLRGNLMLTEDADEAVPEGTVTLYDENNQALATSTLSEEAEFDLPIDKIGQYHLAIGLPDATLTVTGLEIN